MSGQKCPKCGMVSWADAESCRRCGRLFAERVEWSPRGRGARDFNAPSLGTLNGIGTRLLGWTHHEDGTATATVWFTFLYLPVFPLSRHSLLSPGQEDFDPRDSAVRGLHGLAPLRLTTRYYFTGRLTLCGAEVLRTYLYAYVLLPLMLFAPLAAILLFQQMTQPGPEGDSSDTRIVVFGVSMCAWFGYVLFMLATLLHRSRGDTA